MVCTEKTCYSYYSCFCMLERNFFDNRLVCLLVGCLWGILSTISIFVRLRVSTLPQYGMVYDWFG
jgi:uncharacterized integral membrane protein